MDASAPDWIEARPRWCGIRSGAAALGLRRGELLHAGPPLVDPRRPPATLRSSIVISCLHEGWASDEAAAEALVERGALCLMPAQDHDCVTPLAALVSASTPLFAVSDPGCAGSWLHAPVSAVRGVDTRMGFRDPGILQRLRRRDDHVAPALQRWVETHGSLDLWTIALQGLRAGDDLHAVTGDANTALVAALRDGCAADVVDDIAATPLFFLTLWMAACACILRLAQGGARPTLVTRAGGNGQRFGVALAGDPGRWITCDAAPPTGPRLPSIPDQTLVEGAIGDSAVIDMLGFGGQRLAHSPPLMAAFAEHPAAGASLLSEPPEKVLSRAQPLLADAWPLGVDAALVVAHAQTPRVMLAMIARDGLTGLCGRGLYRPPLELFERALHDRR